ncbi:hypothetical protein BH11PSE2_BH11PSE2_19840 [soil metagenome]
MSGQPFSRSARTAVTLAAILAGVVQSGGAANAKSEYFSSELKALDTMMAEMHIGQGAVTPLSPDRARALFKACYTNDVETTRTTFTGALFGACNAVLVRTLKGSPRMVCENLGDARGKLYQVAPKYLPQAPALNAKVLELEKAFFCLKGSIVIQVKPLPPRPAKL